ncbi:MAG: thiamine pyrophosphate-dependent dehydrogenase E1 component subunit alpha [Actinobacteria bacterium]|nr:thiamine pyrophosphate-dependent dehydrogenase E1 component subunit alpha [Actinomycetota bacterium]
MDKNLYLKMLETMQTIRYFEEKVLELYRKGFVPGWLHSYLGEEAVATGACLNLEKDDYITSTHRGHGHCIAKGADLKKMMAELFAKESGYCRGKGGSMHISDASIGILGANGIVGGGIPIATGASLACQYLKTKKVCISFFGDGASNQGGFHESLNMASTWKLPVIYICENNLYAESTAQHRHQNIKDISVRAKAYDMYGQSVDGMDVIEVYEAVKKAVDRARNGEGPTLIEAKTYRYRGHWEGDPEPYRTELEKNEWKKKDPIDRLLTLIKEKNLASDTELTSIKTKIEKEIDDAIDFAKSSKMPADTSALEDLYFNRVVL